MRPAAVAELKTVAIRLKSAEKIILRRVGEEVALGHTHAAAGAEALALVRKAHAAVAALAAPDRDAILTTGAEVAELDRADPPSPVMPRPARRQRATLRPRQVAEVSK
jgi:hypothetical protein